MGTRELFNVDGGFAIGDVAWLSGSGAPSGTDVDNAAIGSMFSDFTNGQSYVKDTSGSGADKWVRQQNQDDINNAIAGRSWREPVDARDDALYADIAAATTALNTDPYTLGGVVLADESEILLTNLTSGTENAYVVTGTPGSGATLVERAVDGVTEALSTHDTMYVKSGTYAGQEYSYNGTSWIYTRQSELTESGYIRSFMGKGAQGNEMPDYPSNDVVTDGESLEQAIGDLDAEIGAACATFQSRTVGPISDQEVNDNIEALDDAIGPDVTSTEQLTAASTVNANLSTLDAKLGNDTTGHQVRTSGPISVQNVNANLEALDDAIGPTPTSTKHISSSSDVNTNISTLDDVLGDAKTESKTDSVSTAATLDSVLVDDVLGAEWTYHARSTVTASKIQSGKILAVHDGTSSADATTADYTRFAVLRMGSAISALSFEVDVDGTGAAQTMRLRCSSTEAVNVRITRAVLNEQ